MQWIIVLQKDFALCFVATCQNESSELGPNSAEVWKSLRGSENKVGYKYKMWFELFCACSVSGCA